MTEIVIPKLTGYQSEVWNWLGDCRGTGKVAVIKSVRQSGKSFLCQMLLIAMSFQHKGISAIFEPTLSQARNQFKQICSFFEGSDLIKNANASLLEIEFVNGSQILFKSTEQSNRGFTVTNVLILDECAYLKDDEIYTILPMVNAHNAPIVIASTPFIAEGYYYEMFNKGLEGNARVKSFDWSTNKEVERFLTPERKAFYKQTMSRAKYQTEVLGQFLNDEGLLFQNLSNCVGQYAAGNYAYIGIDFGTGSEADYTVISAFNERGEQFLLERVNNLAPMKQVDWLSSIINELSKTTKIRQILAEENSIGKVYIDALRAKINIQITNWTTSNSSKQDLVTKMQIALENEYVHLLQDEALLNEMRRYEAEVNPKTKKISYNGKGANDDMVIATMLSYYSYQQKTFNNSYNLGFKRRIN